MSAWVAGGPGWLLLCWMENIKKIEQKALDYIESRFPVGESTCHSLSVTGEPYTVLCVGVEKSGDDKDALSAQGQESLVECFTKAFDDYEKDKVGTLYWRRKPEFLVIDDKWSISARLLISAAPQVDFANSKEVTC